MVKLVHDISDFNSKTKTGNVTGPYHRIIEFLEFSGTPIDMLIVSVSIEQEGRIVYKYQVTVPEDCIDTLVLLTLY